MRTIFILNIIYAISGSGNDGNLAGVVRAREERKSWSLIVTGDGKEDDGFPVCWDRDR